MRRILITRTDRMGDVVLSLPAIKAVRKAFPDAYIAIMVQPRIDDLLKGNPDIDEVIVYDKNKENKGILRNISFIKQLRSKRFDMALIFHTTKRINLICFLAGIPRRIGYARGKADFFLTDKIKYTKKFGEKHEAEYSLDILRHLGINPEFSLPVIYVQNEDERKAESMLKNLNVRPIEKFAILHPGASCVSKMWPLENFARIGDMLIENLKIKVMINLAPDQAGLGEKVRDMMNSKPVFFCEPTALGELAALFKKASLVISNDSGPVHVASGVGVPVISIFGRNQKGLSPVRWRPLGNKAIAIHKDVGCADCLAHDCKKDFMCLKAITVEEVFGEAKKLLNSQILI
ncbi:MAG: lipopolysaccharide heptosyltransferase II [Candidatus Omnitrophota bacterium]|nr:lipopolysaccharide heptosyltransferase II [Candidatus Omnitrophota bacterium]